MSETVLTPFKARARRLGAALRKRNIADLPHTTLLDVIAEVEGQTSWAVLSAAAHNANRPAPRSPAASASGPCADTDTLTGAACARYLNYIADLMDNEVLPQDAVGIASIVLPEDTQWVAHQIRETILETLDYPAAFLGVGFPAYIGPFLRVGISTEKFLVSLRTAAKNVEKEECVRLTRRPGASRYLFHDDSEFMDGFADMLHSRQAEIQRHPDTPEAIARIFWVGSAERVEPRIVELLGMTAQLRLKVKVGRVVRDPAGPHGVVIGDFASPTHFPHEERLIFNSETEFATAAVAFERSRRDALAADPKLSVANLRIRADAIGERAIRNTLDQMIAKARELKLRVFVNEQEQ